MTIAKAAVANQSRVFREVLRLRRSSMISLVSIGRRKQGRERGT
jgi:hypothetical protein